MKIGINARYLRAEHTGIANYLLNLLLGVKKIDSVNEYVLFFDNDRSVPEVIANAGFGYDIAKIPANNQFLKVLWAHTYLPRAIKSAGIDLFHETSFIAPLFKSCPIIITVYDVAFTRIPYCYNYRTRLYFRSLLSRSLRRSDLVVAISETTKSDIVHNFSISPGKIHVIYAGVDKAYRLFDDKEKIEEVKKIYGIKRDFILCVSGITPRKNFVRVIKAFKLLRQEKRIEAQLVFVGQKAWGAEEVFREVRSSGLEADIVFCGYVPKEDLVCLYNTAKALIFASLYEGFGLPILEAFACGCPVVASNVSSMPEVSGGAALLVDPKNVEEMAHAVYKLITGGSLRDDLIGKGLERVKGFSWEKTARETAAVYEAAGRAV